MKYKLEFHEGFYDDVVCHPWHVRWWHADGPDLDIWYKFLLHILSIIYVYEQRDTGQIPVFIIKLIP